MDQPAADQLAVASLADPGAAQLSYIGNNEIAYNAFVGVYGEANFGAFQYVGVYALANNVHDNGTNYLFNAFGGATQNLN